jgi:hypothetical protein
MDPLSERCREICHRMWDWFEVRNYRGTDPYQIDDKITRWGSIPLVGPILDTARRLLKPYHGYLPAGLFNFSPGVLMPHALGLTLSGHATLYALTKESRYLNGAHKVYELIKQSRSPGYDCACWGLPFAWGGQEAHPAHWPTAFTTGYVAHGILDAREILPQEGLSDFLEEIMQSFMKVMGYARLDSGICIYYGPGDQRLIMNSSVLAASAMARYGLMTHDQEKLSFAEEAASFLTHGQNKDGSWYYTDPVNSHVVDTIIDSRHTGFILQHLHIINQIRPRPEVDRAIDQGWRYFRNTLMEGYLPRWSPLQTYPVDIHDVGQTIITALILGKQEIAENLLRIALEKFFDGKDQFYFKLLENGTRNKSVFLRWGQAYMYKALGDYVAQPILRRSVFPESIGSPNFRSDGVVTKN